DGAGRSQAAQAVCHDLGLSLLLVDIEALCAAGENAGRLIQGLLLQQRLQSAGLYLTRCEALFDKEGRPGPESHILLRSLAGAKGLVFIACDSPAPLRELFSTQSTIYFDFDDPDYVTRLQLWEDAVVPSHAKVTRLDLEALADRFVLTPRQI